MFYTLRLRIQKKVDGKYTKTYQYFINDFKKFQKECKENPHSDFKGINCIIQAPNSELSMIFVSTSLEYLENLKEILNSILEEHKVQYGENVKYQFIFGKIKEKLKKMLDY